MDANREARFENVLSFYRFPFHQTVTLNHWLAILGTHKADALILPMVVFRLPSLVISLFMELMVVWLD